MNRKSQKLSGAPIEPQIDRFRATARALGRDEDEGTFKAKLAVIARQNPEDGSPPTRKDK
jgi:hypothetical protein